MTVFDDGLDMRGRRHPCNVPCPKCGSNDISRHYYEAGQFVHSNSQSFAKSGRSTDYVDRSNRFRWGARKETIVHTCRVCGYYFDTGCAESNPAPTLPDEEVEPNAQPEPGPEHPEPVDKEEDPT